MYDSGFQHRESGARVHYLADEHNTGIYSRETLYNLVKHFEERWQQYLRELEKAGYAHKDPAS